MTTFLVEHYWPGVTEAEFGAAAERLRSSADALAREGRPVRYLHSTLVPQDEAAFCVLAAESQALVEEVYARARVRFERVLDAVDWSDSQGQSESGAQGVSEA
ncbi:MAG: DUF4242 domain-containing protein [Actinomycetota bacterium]|nr:DUF4242 domain-containing protein [Actinomycetota bacterium]